MALLAAGKRKQRISIDPRGLHWRNDDSKFGKKMLEKFGWSQGKGLGAKETGRVDHVKLQFKNDNRGVGFTKKEENNWIPLQDDFSDLLATLNANHDQGESSDAGQVQSLEERSKTSKGRLHYHKFTRGKDLSKKNREDLNCIFGKRKSKSAPVTPQNMSQANSTVNSEGNSDAEESQKVTTISSLSVQDYFRLKMEQLKTKQANSSAPNLVSMGEENNVDSEEVMEKKKRNKSKKKDKESSDENMDASQNDSETNPRKRKLEDEEDGVEIRKRVMFTVGEDETNSEEGAEVTKSKKKKKKKSKEKYDAESQSDSETNPRKRKLDDEEDGVEIRKRVMFTVGEDETNSEEGAEVTKSKKKKKKKSKEKYDAELQDEVSEELVTKEEENNSEEVVEEDSVSRSEKKKKKKKNKSKERDNEDKQEKLGNDTQVENNTDDVADVTPDTENVEESNSDENKSEKKKKKKKKSSRKEQDESEETNMVAENSASGANMAKTFSADAPDTVKKNERTIQSWAGRNINDLPGVSWPKGYAGGVSLKHHYTKKKSFW